MKISRQLPHSVVGQQWLRMTIARKIALAVMLIVVLCIGTMAWVTSQNLNRGFLTYLDQLQLKELAPVRDLISIRYQQEGNFLWLQRNHREMRNIFEQVRGSNAARLPPPPQRFRPDSPGAEDEGPPGRPPDAEFARRPPPPPPPEGLNPRPRRGPRPGEAAYDPMGYGRRLSIVDEHGRNVLGPPPMAEAMYLPIVVEGRQVGKIYLARLEQIGAAEDSANALKFVRGQIADTLWLAAGLAVIAVLLAMMLARHFLRPIIALRSTTERIARGEFDARAPLLGSDELAQLAAHVNQMAAALEQSEQQRRQMMADIAHELRTPLTVIRGEIEALLDGIRRLDNKAMESLHVEVLRLNKMVDDVHQLTLADVGDLHFNFQELNVVELLQPVLARYELRASKAGLTLSWDLPRQVPTIQADSGRLTQVITNLLENSVRYTDTGGRIVLQLQQTEGMLLMQIDDSAPGVPEGSHGRLFERLYRVDQARSRERGGSGLGLSICQALVEAHGGKIQARASSLGGVCMLITIPFKRLHMAADATNLARQ